MDEDGQEDDYSSLDSNESLAVDQSSSLQVETLGHWEQIESGDRSKETADTQRVAWDAHLPQVRRSCGTSKGYSYSKS